MKDEEKGGKHYKHDEKEWILHTHHNAHKVSSVIESRTCWSYKNLDSYTITFNEVRVFVGSRLYFEFTYLKLRLILVFIPSYLYIILHMIYLTRLQYISIDHS